jgi:hypothetical protein
MVFMKRLLGDDPCPARERSRQINVHPAHKKSMENVDTKRVIGCGA